MKLADKSTGVLTILAVISVGLYILFVSGCASTPLFEQPASAQSNQTNTYLVNKHSEIEILKGVGEPCDFNKTGFDWDREKKDANFQLYELIYAGFPKEVSLDEAVSVFNRFAQCDERSKSQMPLTANELIAAIRGWDCTKEKGETNKKLCADAWKIAKTGKMPKGSFIDFDCGATRSCSVYGYKGYDVNAWQIDLYLWLDKYRRDMKDEPVYSHLIRLKYISSEPKK